MKRICMALLTMAILTASSAVGYAEAETAIISGVASVPTVRVMESEDITAEVLEARHNKYILVECIDGICLDDDGNGRTSDGYYISYRRVSGARAGAKFRTICLYANSPYVDDIVERIDMGV